MKSSSFDINRDFPFNIKNDDECLNTIASRVIHELFTHNLMVSSLTFHGGMSALAYPYGSFFHSKEALDFKGFTATQSPDEIVFKEIGKIINNFSLVSYQSESDENTMIPYQFGDISSTIYPVNGGLEDWAYGAGWDYETDGTFL